MLSFIPKTIPPSKRLAILTPNDKIMTLHRPAPILKANAATIDQRTSPQQAVSRLRKGEQLIVTDQYSTGANILDQLSLTLRPPSASATYPIKRAFQKKFRKVALRLLVNIRNHKVQLSDARDIGLLTELYPKISSFSLPFIQMQELFGAWNTYIHGVHFAVLGHKIHPFYGTYAPTRTSHLELFATWLSQYKGSREQAIDVGTGSGILAFILAKNRFQKITATDSNPNAIESVVREKQRLSSRSIEAVHCDLLTKAPQPVDLIVFNPPWIQGDIEGLIDGALYYEDGLFERFFAQARTALHRDGRLVLLFSNIMTLVRPGIEHPILAELKKGHFRLVQKMNRKVKPSKTADGKRRRTKEKVEVWELALS